MCYCDSIGMCRKEDLEELQNGIFTVTGYFVNDTVNYFCKHRYQLIGNQFRTCTPNGYWDKQIPECKRMYA